MNQENEAKTPDGGYKNNLTVDSFFGTDSRRGSRSRTSSYSQTSHNRWENTDPILQNKLLVAFKEKLFNLYQKWRQCYVFTSFTL